jgi:argininosuccinate lyase
VVQKAVRDLSDRGLPGAALDARAVARAAADVVGEAWQLDDHELAAVLDPRALVASRTALGGAAPPAVRAMLGRVRAHAGQVGEQVAGHRAAVRAAEQVVLSRARELAGR